MGVGTRYAAAVRDKRSTTTQFTGYVLNRREVKEEFTRNSSAPETTNHPTATFYGLQTRLDEDAYAIP
ncbi:hypothetical protein J6590_026214 [Homalodisca vitripennis]|nr:hypothetical protein J6590_026214 [Homalodisca vitripennis]